MKSRIILLCIMASVTLAACQTPRERMEAKHNDAMREGIKDALKKKKTK